MSTIVNPAAPHDLPSFITAPGESDVLFNAVMIFLGAIFLSVMLFYFRLHALPEHIAHRGEKIQYQIVAVLCLISLFTHNHIFWIFALLLALISVPDFTTPLREMSESLAKIAASKQPALNIDPLPPSSRTPAYLQKAASETKDHRRV
jgi:hypothetical protein